MTRMRRAAGGKRQGCKFVASEREPLATFSMEYLRQAEPGCSSVVSFPFISDAVTFGRKISVKSRQITFTHPDTEQQCKGEDDDFRIRPAGINSFPIRLTVTVVAPATSASRGSLMDGFRRTEFRYVTT